MHPGDVVLIELPQLAGGTPKLRPAMVLALLPGSFQNRCYLLFAIWVSIGQP
jgi:hypothetical protein